MAKTEFARFDAAEYLEDPDPEVFMMAVSNVAQARGIAKIAKDSGLGRERLYIALAHP
jgi:probable addiction module antidote protein